MKINNLAFADDIVLPQIMNTNSKNWSLQWQSQKKPKILLDSECLEVVSAYKYLGVWFDSKLDWKLHKETILAKRRAYTMMRFGICKTLPVKTCVNLWEVLIRPILEYAEVWGGGVWEAAEKLQREIGKLILGAPTRTANEVVLGGSGMVGTQGSQGQGPA